MPDVFRGRAWYGPRIRTCSGLSSPALGSGDIPGCRSSCQRMPYPSPHPHRARNPGTVPLPYRGVRA